MNRDCPFCRIAAGEIKADIVLENPDVVAFRDINPQAPVHVLIIPRRHLARLSELDPGESRLLGRVQAAINEIAATLPAGRREFRLVVNEGAAAGQTVFHLHYHFLAGRDFGWPPG
jgi:histidine triad (HIT) family protein